MLQEGGRWFWGFDGSGVRASELWLSSCVWMGWDGISTEESSLHLVASW